MMAPSGSAPSERKADVASLPGVESIGLALASGPLLVLESTPPAPESRRSTVADSGIEADPLRPRQTRLRYWKSQRFARLIRMNSRYRPGLGLVGALHCTADRHRQSEA